MNIRGDSKRGLILILIVMSGLAGHGSVMATTTEFKKCKDANGKWHYGDYAAQECARSVITRVDEQGIKRGEELPPPSKEELDRQNTDTNKAEDIRKQRAAQKQKDDEFLHIYGSEEVITSSRDRKLTSIDKTIEVTEQIKSGIVKDIKDLEGRKQSERVKKLIAERENAIKSYDRVIRQNLSERLKLEKKYKQILSDFRAAYARSTNTTQ